MAATQRGWRRRNWTSSADFGPSAIPCASAISHLTTYRYDDAGGERDPDAAADAAQPRRPVCRALAHRRLRRLPPGPARGRLRQHHPYASPPTARSSELQRAGRGRGRDPATPRASCAARSSGFRRALFLRETALTATDAAIAAFAAALPRRRRRRRARAAARHAGAAARRDRPSTPTRPMPRPPRRKPSRSSAASARTSPISSSRRRAASASRRAMSAAISTATTA